MKVKFLSTVGVEFSYLFEQDINETRKRALAAIQKGRDPYKDDEDRYGQDYAEKNVVAPICRLFNYGFLKEAANNRNRRHWASTNVHNDEDAIEVSSPIFEDWADCRDFYRYMTKLKGMFPIETHREDSYSGGGHIHIGVNTNNFMGFKLTNAELFKFFVALYQDLNNRPYLNWIFNEYCDLCSAEPLCMLKGGLFSDGIIEKYIFGTHNFESFCRERGIKEWQQESPLTKEKIFSNLCFSKGYMARVDNAHKTVEFRFFDMVRSEEQLALHIRFVMAYTRHILSKVLGARYCNIPITVHGKNDCLALARKDKGLHEFYRLLDTLKLDKEDFKEVIAMNYQKRKRAGLLGKVGS